MNGHDARMSELGDLAGLIKKSCSLLWRTQATRARDFDCYWPLNVGIEAFPDLPKTTRSDQGIQSIAAQSLGHWLQVVFFAVVSTRGIEPFHPLKGFDTLPDDIEKIGMLLAQFFNGHLSIVLPKVFPPFENDFNSWIFRHINSQAIGHPGLRKL